MSKTKPYGADDYGWDAFVKVSVEQELNDPETDAETDWMPFWLLWKAGFTAGFANGMIYQPGNLIPGDETEERPQVKYLSEKDEKEQEHPFMHFMRSFLRR